VLAASAMVVGRASSLFVEGCNQGFGEVSAGVSLSSVVARQIKIVIVGLGFIF
jgi:hypothetical protein